MEKVIVTEKFDLVDEYWHPKIIADLNGQAVKIVKLKGEFVWHHHVNEDELFYVLKGTLMMKFRDHDVLLREGEMIVVPRGIEHKPVADTEVWLMLFEPVGTLNTGNVNSTMTVPQPERL